MRVVAFLLVTSFILASTEAYACHDCNDSTVKTPATHCAQCCPAHNLAPTPAQSPLVTSDLKPASHFNFDIFSFPNSVFFSRTERPPIVV